MGYNTAAQALRNADAYKTKVNIKRDLLADAEAWSDQQQLQSIYHEVIFLDLEYALDKKVEQELWTYGFKHYINLLQEQIKTNKSARGDLQALLTSLLDSASGFYISLLQELAAVFDLKLSFLSDNDTQCASSISGRFSEPMLAQSSSSNYICQYCLVHLGDIARYRKEKLQATNFYKHAMVVSPFNGQPYNQLGLLEASQGNKLAAVYNYILGIAVKNPFPGAVANFTTTLNSVINKNEFFSEFQPKLTADQYILQFLQAQAFLYNSIELDQCEVNIKSMNSALSSLVATSAFSSQQLIQFSIITFYAIHHLVGENVCKLDELTEDEKLAREVALTLLSGTLNSLLLPVYTKKSDESILEYVGLPSIKLILSWIQKHHHVLKERSFTNRLQIWPSFCKFLNTFNSFLDVGETNKNNDVPLPEDNDIHSFLPCAFMMRKLNFKKVSFATKLENKLRAARLIKLGHWLSSLNVDDRKLIICNKSTDDGAITFEPICLQPDPTIELLAEMKSITILESKPDKKVGILKPQGSLEKSREERENKASEVQIQEVASETDDVYLTGIDNEKLKRVQQNVALQSIFKKIEENKQVTFCASTADDTASPPPQPFNSRHQQQMQQEQEILKPGAMKQLLQSGPLPPHSNQLMPQFQPQLHMPFSNPSAAQMQRTPPQQHHAHPVDFFMPNIPPPPIHNHNQHTPLMSKPPPTTSIGGFPTQWHNPIDGPHHQLGMRPAPQQHQTMSQLHFNDISFPQFMQPPPSMNAPQQQPNQARYGMPPSTNNPWLTTNHSGNMATPGNSTSTSSMNMRQAMLSEAAGHFGMPGAQHTAIGGGVGRGNAVTHNSPFGNGPPPSLHLTPQRNNNMQHQQLSHQPNPQFGNNSANAPGYSLFNSYSSWSPINLGGIHQQKNDGLKKTPPQSLQQLIEQQSRAQPE